MINIVTDAISVTVNSELCFKCNNAIRTTIRCINYGENKYLRYHLLPPGIEEYVEENVDAVTVNIVMRERGSERKYKPSDSLFPENIL